MINSCRTYSHNQLKQILKQAKQNIRDKKMSLVITRGDKNIQNRQISKDMCQIIRDHQLKIMELKNQVIKKQIQVKQRTQAIKDISKENQLLKRQKEGFNKIKQKFENQRKNYNEKIDHLQETITNLQQKLEYSKPPKDRYQTCIRQLDQLKINIDYKQDASKERDFYKYIFQQIKQLVISPFYSPQELQTNLKSLFLDIDEKLQNGK